MILGLALAALVGGAMLFDQSAAPPFLSLSTSTTPLPSQTGQPPAAALPTANEYAIPSSANNNPAVVLGALGTRLGILIIVGYLVQLLIATYRYNTRMAAYYDSRADALELTGSQRDVTCFTHLVTAISPDHINFAKAPTLGANTAVDAIKRSIGLNDG